MTYKAHILVFSGWSGAGKDTAASSLDAVNIKFASPGKRALEFILKIPYGAMDDREYRQRIAPHCQGRTYLQVLMDFYHHRDKVIGGDLFTAQTYEDILLQLNTGKNVAITDMRNSDECNALMRLRHKGYLVLPFWISGGAQLSTDAIQYSLYQELASDGSGTFLNNDFQLPSFPDKVREIVADRLVNLGNLSYNKYM